MLNFYPIPQNLLVLISMVSAFCVITQSTAFILCIHRYRRSWTQRLENTLESAILLQVLTLSLLIAQVQTNIQDNLIIPSGNIATRYILFGIVFILAGSVCYFGKTWRPVFPVIAGLLALPFIEMLLKDIFPVIYIICLIYYSSHSIYILLIRRRELTTNISELSIKEAIDALQTGILFCEPDGHIILINKKMQSLMLSLTDMVWRNGMEFLNQITKRKLLREGEEAELDGRMVFRLRDRSVWMFNDSLLQINKKKYHQITAADVTENWDATALLRDQNMKLDRRGEELKQTIANMQTIYQKEEALRAQSRIHDVLGQRIALLIRALHEDGNPDETLLKVFIEGWHTRFIESEADHNPERKLEALRDMFTEIGVNITIHGGLPENTELAVALVEIITEGVTNAVRHGYAKEIDISCVKDDVTWILTIINSGLSPAGSITEGGGITSMRHRLSVLGGTLEIKTHPRFMLTAMLREEG